MAVISEWHSSSRMELNKRRTVCIIYKMCYCLSHMDTQFQLGNTCSRKTTKSKLNKLSNDHHNDLENLFSEAIKNEWLLVLIIDDFTKIHTNRGPNHQQFSNCMSMCTIVIKAFKSLKAVKKPKNISKIHHHEGINIKAFIDAITAAQSMALLSTTYSHTMPQWLTKSLFTPDLERQILEEHLYCDDSVNS